MQMLPPADSNPPKIKNSNNGSSGGGAVMLRPPAEQGLKCPRCDSANTKFCYYNNYSLSQPRHFCKTCRRYWTRGGALRNVPVGGGCRKSKKSKSASSSAAAAGGGSSSSCSAAVPMSSSSSMGNFQLGMLPSGVFNGGNQFIGFNYPIAAASPVGVNQMGSSAADDQIMFGFGGGAHHHHHQSSSIALSIESLSSMNQDLHWKLQQQRLAMLFGGGGDQNQNKPATPLLENHHQMMEPISFQVADEGAKGEICGPRKSDAAAGATAWFLEGSSPANYSNGRINGGGSSNINNSTSDWNGIITWSDMPHFSALP